MTLVPGRGTEGLHLGQSSTSVLRSFGEPQGRRVVSPLREYWIYPQHGFECIVSLRSLRVLSIFFQQSLSGSVDLLGLSEERIQQIFSKPSQLGGGFKLNGGDYIGRWYSYYSGIGFHFDESGLVTTVSVFAAKRKTPAKNAASHAGSSSRRIAALLSK